MRGGGAERRSQFWYMYDLHNFERNIFISFFVNVEMDF